MPEQEMRSWFFEVTGKIATSSPNTYSLFKKAVLAEREACHTTCRELAKRMKTAAEKDAANSCAEVIYMRSNV